MQETILKQIAQYDPETLDEEEMDRIAETFDSVEMCDLFSRELFAKNRWSLHKTIEWVRAENPLMRRAAYTLMQSWAEADNELKNQIFYTFIPLLKAGREDTEPMVRDAVKEAVKALSGRNEKLRKRLEVLSEQREGR